jgi:hypothetical protein
VNGDHEGTDAHAWHNDDWQHEAEWYDGHPWDRVVSAPDPSSVKDRAVDVLTDEAKHDSWMLKDSAEWVAGLLDEAGLLCHHEPWGNVVAELAARTSPTMPDRDRVAHALMVAYNSPEGTGRWDRRLADAVMALLAETGWQRPLSRDEMADVITDEAAGLLSEPHIRTIASALFEAARTKQEDDSE